MNHPILNKYKEVLSNIGRVFQVCYSDTKEFYVEECCDFYYKYYLTKEDCLSLSEMFKDIATCIE